MVDIKEFRSKCTWYRANGKRAAGITKVELAKRLGRGVRTIYRWENEPETQPDNIKELLFDCFMQYEDALTMYKNRGKGHF